MTSRAIITWIIFQTSNSTTFSLKHSELFKDPAWESYIPKEEFVNIYRGVLETFDGGDMCSYMDFYFKPSPVNNTIYEFIDEDSRNDFRDIAEELGLIPKVKEIMEGEDEKAKALRKDRESKKKMVRDINMKPKKNKLLAIQTEIDKILQLMGLETDPKQLERLHIKLKKAMELSQKSI